MSSASEQTWWEEVPTHIGGDAAIAHIGAGATNVIVGKNITQSVYDTLGEPTPKDKDIIKQEFAEVNAALQETREQLDANTVQMAEFQLKLLEGELNKTEEEQMPSASTITQVGDWLLDNVPEIAEVITGLFATPAIGRVVGKAGEGAVQWLKGRFKQSA
jgi:hypothetical protein